MSATVVLWTLLILGQGSTGTAPVFSSKADCEEYRTDALLEPDVLAISECTEITLKGTKKQDKSLQGWREEWYGS